MELKITQTIGDTIQIEKNVMTVTISDYEIGLRQMLEAEQSNTTTATDNITLTDADLVIQVIDPGGSNRDVTLPDESVDNHGYLIINTADAAEQLTIKNDAGVEVGMVYEGGAGWFISNGTAWRSAGLGTTDVGTLRIVHWRIVPSFDALTVGDGKDIFHVPEELNGWNLENAHAAVDTVSSSGTPTFQIHNLTDTADMLSTRITIDESEYNSYTAAAQPVIDTAHDDVATGDRLRADVDVAGTGTKGAIIIMTFQQV